MVSDITFGGFARWLPLDLDFDPEVKPGEVSAAHAARLVADYPNDPHATEMAPAVTSMAGQLAATRRARLSDTDPFLMAAWLLLADEQTLSPVAHATFQSMPWPTGQETLDVVRDLLSGHEVHGAPAWREFETASGPATLVHHRLRALRDGEWVAHERAAVLWARPDDGLLLVLDGYTDDPRGCPDLAPAIHQLAVSASGL